jgi:hypothetical protein
MAPVPYAVTQPLLRQNILERIAAGERLSHICAEPGMPCHESVWAWAKAEPLFGEALAAARRKANWARRWRFDEAKAKALLARLAAGEGIVSILRDPAMPSRGVYRYWRQTEAPFQEAVHRLNQLKEQQKAERPPNPLREFDQALADRIVSRVAHGEGLHSILNAANGLPCRNVVIRWRREQPDFDLALKIALRVKRRQPAPTPSYTPAVVEAITAQVRQGVSLATLGLRPDMPCRATLYEWMRTRPDFAAAVEQAHAERADWYCDLILELSEQPRTPAVRREIERLSLRLKRLETRKPRDRGKP